MGASLHGGIEGRRVGRLLAAICALVLVGDVTALLTVGATRGRAADDEAGRAASTSGSGLDASGRAPGRSGDPGTAPKSATGPAEAGQQVTTTTAPLAAVGRQGWDFPATLTPTCGPVGQQFKLTLGLGVKGSAVLSVVYGDDDTTGPKAFAEGGPDGSYSFTWNAVAAPSDGLILIAASDATRANQGTKSVPFRITGPAERC